MKLLELVIKCEINKIIFWIFTTRSRSNNACKGIEKPLAEYYLKMVKKVIGRDA